MAADLMDTMSVLRIALAIIVTAMWATVYTADVLSETFSAPPEISAPMLAVITWAFGSEIRKQLNQKKNGGGNGGEQG